MFYNLRFKLCHLRYPLSRVFNGVRIFCTAITYYRYKLQYKRYKGFDRFTGIPGLFFPLLRYIRHLLSVYRRKSYPKADLETEQVFFL